MKSFFWCVETVVWQGAILCSAAISIALGGCCNDKLRSFGNTEAEALKFGTVSVGAVRVVDYDNAVLEGLRCDLKTKLKTIGERLSNQSLVPEGCESSARDVNTTARAEASPGNLASSGVREKKEGSSQGGAKNQSARKSSEPGGMTPRANEMDLVGLRIATLKLLESEMEDLNMGDMVPVAPGLRRVVLSLDCSAWVRGEAGAALVYVDLYPFQG